MKWLAKLEPVEDVHGLDRASFEQALSLAFEQQDLSGNGTLHFGDIIKALREAEAFSLTSEEINCVLSLMVTDDQGNVEFRALVEEAFGLLTTYSMHRAVDDAMQMT